MKVYLPNPKFIFSVLIHAVIYYWDVKLWGTDSYSELHGTTTLGITVNSVMFAIGIDGLALTAFDADDLGAACIGWRFIGNNQLKLKFAFAPMEFQYLAIAR